ncbi:MAG: hypothetical protein K0R02_510 [Rickettsiaceae bacterium]|jgi:signal transduction histidine kinase/Na+/proline symporter/CheY-like chemotaxis protein|nr:hypothetical protein [Rickettsiaceae bacterium]
MLDLVIPLIYLSGLLLVGVFSGIKVRTSIDYTIGNANYSTARVVSAIFVTIIGSESLVWSAERNSQIGLISIFITLGISINRIITAKFLAHKIYTYRDNLSVSGIIGYIYGKEARILTGVINLAYSLIVICAQALLIINIFYYFFGIEPIFSIFIGLGGVIIYSSLGGIKGIINTSLMQCLILIITIPILFNLGIESLGGYDAFWEVLPATKFHHLVSKQNVNHCLLTFVVLAIFSLDPVSIQRILICRDQKQSAKTLYITGIIIIPFLIIAGLNGILSLLMIPGVEPNFNLSNIIESVLPEINQGFVAIGLLAIIISTADSQLNSATIAVVNDILLPILGLNIRLETHLKLLRIIGIILGVGVAFFVINVPLTQDIIYYAYKIWAPIIPLLVLGLYDIKFAQRAYISSCIICLISIFAIDNIFNVYSSFIAIIPAVILQSIYLTIVLCYLEQRSLTKVLSYVLIKFIKTKYRFLAKVVSYIKYIFSESIFDRLVDFSASRVELHGAYYVAFGVFGTINYIIPYFVWTHETINDYLTLILRIIASILCFMLILKYQSKDLDKENYDSRTLPFYWHVTLLFCLPLMSTYTLLVSGFATTWLINATLSIFILVLLVDWITFTVILPLGFALGYTIYMLRTGHLEIYFIKENLYLTIYLNSFALLIGVFFLYHKEKMIKAVIDAKNKLEIMNAELEDKVQKRTDTLKQALNVKTEFLNNISHEVRTPLQGITGISTELVEQWQRLSDNERYAYVKTVASNSNRLISLVSNLLDLSKFDSGKMLFDMEKADLQEIVKEIIDELEIFNLKQDVEIELIQISLDTKVLADRNRIAQVVRNLLSNSLKFTDKGTITVKLEQVNIEDWNEAFKTGIMVSIKDMGPGIPEGELSVIFQPFTQSSRTKTKAGGTGLGLAISSEIVHAHNGKIWAENNEDKGATFSFIIPSPPQSKLEAPSFEHENDHVHSKLQNKKVLLVDDEQSCLISGSLILQSAGFEVVTADGGESALKSLREEEFCLVFLDLMMPDIYGLDVLAEMKNDPKMKRTPVVLQTGASDNVEIAKAFSMGIAAYISKPYDKKRMTKIINEVLKDQQK